MTDTWQTYVQAAQALGLTVEGVRQRARREMWRKQVGNDGRARVIVPIDTTAPPAPADDTPGNRPEARPNTKRLPAAAPAGEVNALQARITDLQSELARSWQDVDRERTERHRERDRADRLASDLSGLVERIVEAERDRAVAVANTDRALEETERVRSTSEAEIETLRKTLAEMHARPWWRRLVG